MLIAIAGAELERARVGAEGVVETCVGGAAHVTA